jgi:hypothetical protein
MTTMQELEQAIDRLRTASLRVKEQRDSLLKVVHEVWKELDEQYDVDQPELGHYKEYPFSGAGQLMSKCRNTLEKCGVKL